MKQKFPFYGKNLPFEKPGDPRILFRLSISDLQFIVTSKDETNKPETVIKPQSVIFYLYSMLPDNFRSLASIMFVVLCRRNPIQMTIKCPTIMRYRPGL